MRRLFSALAAVALGFAPAPFPRQEKPDPTPADRKALVGEWEIVCVMGQPWFFRADIGYRCRFDDSRMSLGYPDGWNCGKWRLTLDAKATPKRMGLATVSLPGSKPQPHIYQLQGDVLVIGFAREGVPPDFMPREGSSFIVMQRMRR